MIVLKQIRWKNFLSTGNIFTEINLNSNGTTLIVGENGAGKSTILDALTYALFGKSFRNINKPQLINTINRKDMVVELEFHAMSNEYLIRRGMKPGIFEVYCNDKLINQSAEMRDYQEILEKQILKINYKSFCQVVVLGSASFVPFMQLPAAQRRAIIEDLLDLEVFTAMNTLLKEKVQLNLQGIYDNENEMTMIDEKIKMVKSHLDELQRMNKTFIKQKKQAIADSEKKLESIKDISASLKIDIQNLENMIDGHSQLKSKLDRLKDIRSQLDSKGKQIKRELAFFDMHDNCPTCMQKIDESFKCDTVDQKSHQLAELEDGMRLLSEKYTETNKALNEILEIQGQIYDKKMELTANGINESHIVKQIEGYHKEIKEANKHVKESETDRLVDLEADRVRIVSKYNDLQENKQVLSTAAALLKDGGIKTKIINQYIPVINKLINMYLSEFDLFVEFHLDEQFNEIIKSRYRDEFSYASFSEGEKQKIDLAILFTWRAVAKLRNSLNTNVLILDEVFDSSLDGNAADDLLKILANIAQETNVFIISHRDTLFEKFDKTIKFNKRKNFSAIEGSP